MKKGIFLLLHSVLLCLACSLATTLVAVTQETTNNGSFMVPQFIWKDDQFIGTKNRDHYLRTKDVRALPRDCWNSKIVQRTVNPQNECGTEGSISARIDDCADKNPYNSSRSIRECNAPLKGWALVTKMPTGEEVWLDTTNDLLYSDLIVEHSKNRNRFSWCWASGANNKEGGKYASLDPDGYCSQPPYQDQDNPVSLCYEDPEELHTPEFTKRAKGNLGAQDNVIWHLPSAREWAISSKEGARKILPRLEPHSNYSHIWNWTSSLFWWENPDNGLMWRADHTWRYVGGAGTFSPSGMRSDSDIVRCVAHIPTYQ